MEYTRNTQGISINIYGIKYSETQTQWGGSKRRPPHWGAAESGACVSDYLISEIFMAIPYIFLIFSIYIYMYIYVKYIYIYIYIYIRNV